MRIQLANGIFSYEMQILLALEILSPCQKCRETFAQYTICGRCPVVLVLYIV
jgi:hypothetical protein